MELSDLKGSIVGIISDDYQSDDYSDKKVGDLITYKVNESLKMVKLDESILEKKIGDLSLSNKNKVILASKLHDKEIVLYDFSAGLTTKDIVYFKGLFKKISAYKRRIFLVDKNAEMFLNCTDAFYVMVDGKIKYNTTNIFDKVLGLYIDLPKIVEFANKCEKLGIRLDHYTELDELLKAIYRIKS